MIDDDHASRDLPPAWKAALAYTDHALLSPGPTPPKIKAGLDEHFDVAEQVELGVGLGLFHGFSKMLIALGVEPGRMDTMVLETPLVRGAEAPPAPAGDRYVALFGPRTDLANRWHAMRLALTAVDALDSRVLDAARARVATLLGSDLGSMRHHPNPDDAAAHMLAVEIAELFIVDVRQLATGTAVDRFRDMWGEAALAQLVMTLAIFDGIYRYAVCKNDSAT